MINDNRKVLFTSESVTEGHPDKISDKISDAILDELLRQDPMSRVACETFCTTGLVAIMGEITTKATVDFQKIVRETVREIGYDRAKYGFDCDSCAVITTIDGQSADIAMGVDLCAEAKAGDKFQFLRNGYFCVDSRYSTPDHLVFNETVSLKGNYKPE